KHGYQRDLPVSGDAIKSDDHGIFSVSTFLPCPAPATDGDVPLVAVVLRLVRTLDVHAAVLRLLLGQLRELAAERLDVDAGDLLVQDLRQAVDPVAVLIGVLERPDLRDGLVREGGGHGEGRVAGGVTQVQQAPLGEDDDAALRALGVREAELVDLRLDVYAGDVVAVQEAGHVDLVVEVADVAQDGVVLHLLHLLEGDDAQVARRGDDDVRRTDGVVDGDDREAVHQRLQRVDRVRLGDDDARTLTSEGLGAALADVAVAADQNGLAADEHVGGAVDAVQEAVAGAVLVIELGLGDRVVDVH